MKIPEVRMTLTDQAHRMEVTMRMAGIPQDVREIIAGEIRLVYLMVRELYRRKATRRTKAKSAKVTPALAREVRRLCAAHPDLSYQDIAVMVGTNMGRVSEIMGGFRQ